MNCPFTTVSLQEFAVAAGSVLRQNQILPSLCSL